jgi:hypothetical protein
MYETGRSTEVPRQRSCADFMGSLGGCVMPFSEMIAGNGAFLEMIPPLRLARARIPCSIARKLRACGSSSSSENPFVSREGVRVIPEGKTKKD